MTRNAWVAVLLAALFVASLGTVQPAAAAVKPVPDPVSKGGGLFGLPRVGAEVPELRTEDSKTFVGEVPGQ